MLMGRRGRGVRGLREKGRQEEWGVGVCVSVCVCVCVCV